MRKSGKNIYKKRDKAKALRYVNAICPVGRDMQRKALRGGNHSKTSPEATYRIENISQRKLYRASESEYIVKIRGQF